MSAPHDWPSPHISHSQVSTYVMCPERYRQRYVLGRAPAHRSGEQVFGSAIHAALAVYHQRLHDDGCALTTDELETEFDDLFAVAQEGPLAILWPDTESPARLRDQGHGLLRLYCETAKVGRVLAVERPFAVSSNTLPEAFYFPETLVGIVDLVEQDDDGQVFITELKTSSRRYDESRLRYDLQLSVYAAIAAALGFPDARVRFRVLIRTKTPQIQTVEVVRSPEQLEEAGNVMSQVLRGIDHRVFYPNRGHGCAGCGYRSRCGT